MCTISFKGTRHGMTKAQKAAFRRMLTEMEGQELHLGGCIVADAEAAEIAARKSRYVVCYPSIEEAQSQVPRDFKVETLEAQTTLARNRILVHRADLLIACPHDMEAINKGTLGELAFTLNYARIRGKEVCIIWPDGSIEREPPAIQGMISDRRSTIERRIRPETIYINRVPVVFFKCPKKKRWCIRVIGGRVRFPKRNSRAPRD
ncbi:hypothetical protein ETAA8_54080 [Anatilimnocola aggregata]|uniref:Uncharacterized protein n=1 Tax=Anatilimnocola aggregata TaxID=2528021 RepID=A0A517YJ94_9BACT|nr:hypothetical protein ETAA8_54080 [Anatilimnocola aggregata]